MKLAVEPLDRADQSVVIVGAGLAGVRVAEAVRQAGFPGEVILVGDEIAQPYDRPPLSKAVLTIEGHEHEIALSPEGAMAAIDVTLRLGCPAVAIARAARELVLADGERLRYDRLVLATGSRPRALALLPPGTPRVSYLRSLDDALALRTALQRGAPVAIIGGGVIGLEVAASARSLGCPVTIIEAGARLMARAAAPVISRFIQERHRMEGVDIRLSTTVETVEPGAAGLSLRLTDGTVVEAGIVVIGIGVLPNLELARECGLELRPDGILVDGHGATSDPAIYAAGEVTVHVNAAQDQLDRQETWAHAAAHGEHVGRALVAQDAIYHQLASYWTDQYDINLQVVGAPIGETDILRGDPASGRFLVFHLGAGRVSGVSAVNAVRELRLAKRLIGRPISEPGALGDPAQDLAKLA